MTKVTREEVEHIAHLARLQISEEETEAQQDKLMFHVKYRVVG